jgi:hypothetical protein
VEAAETAGLAVRGPDSKPEESGRLRSPDVRGVRDQRSPAGGSSLCCRVATGECDGSAGGPYWADSMIVFFRDQFFGAAFGLALSAVITFALARVRISRAKRLWRLEKPDSLTVVLSTSGYELTEAYERKMTGLGQARALGMLVPSLTRAYGNINTNAVTLSVYSDGASREGDLILLGGPKNNEVTRDVLLRLATVLPVTLRTEGDEVIVRRTADGGEEVLEPASTPSPSRDRPGYDYGYILRARNCFNSATSMTVFAGTHTYGTAAAVRYFLENAKMLRSLGGHQYVLVVKVRVMGDEYIETPVLHLGPIEF